MPHIRSASTVAAFSAFAILWSAAASDSSDPIAKGSAYRTTLLEKGSGSMYRSQDFRNLGRALEEVIGRIQALVSRASSTTPGWTTRGGPLGPSTVSAAWRPERTNR